jgi:hypothetical protein
MRQRALEHLELVYLPETFTTRFIILCRCDELKAVRRTDFPISGQSTLKKGGRTLVHFVVLIVVATQPGFIERLFR